MAVLPGPLPQERGKHAQFPEFSRPLVWNCFMGTNVGCYFFDRLLRWNDFVGGAFQHRKGPGGRSIDSPSSSLSRSGIRVSSACEQTKKTLVASALLLSFSIPLRAEVTDPIALWPNAAPGALGNEEKDMPAITQYVPELDKATGTALVVCPGGGYGGLSPHEGKEHAPL